MICTVYNAPIFEVCSFNVIGTFPKFCTYFLDKSYFVCVLIVPNFLSCILVSHFFYLILAFCPRFSHPFALKECPGNFDHVSACCRSTACTPRINTFSFSHDTFTTCMSYTVAFTVHSPKLVVMYHRLLINREVVYVNLV